MKVYQAISAVQGELAKTGIGKDSENKFDNYKFRGIDAVYNALSPILAKNGLCILPRILDRTCEERQSQKGGVLFYVTVTAEFDLVAAEDGSKHTIRTYGEAMDRGDKATNKAMSAAYKYAAFQAFAIPTEGDNDADAQTHEVAAKPKITPAAGAMDHLTPEQRREMEFTADAVTVRFREEGGEAAAALVDSFDFSQEDKVALWSLLDSKVRAGIKKAKETKK